ncbi:MAG: hypothetical protein Q8L93_04335 [Rhodocyclaceae bacterium]|nr:hypothetical protein [Rhodocyclaceae bacterium]
MNANKFYRCVGFVLLLGFASSAVYATQGLDAPAQTKVNNARAKAWTDGSIKNPEHQKTVVNVGNKRDGGCSDVNIGTAKPGEKAPKNIVVTTKQVINVCK